jgi:hypothetical protein
LDEEELDDPHAARESDSARVVARASVRLRCMRSPSFRRRGDEGDQRLLSRLAVRG